LAKLVGVLAWAWKKFCSFGISIVVEWSASSVSSIMEHFKVVEWKSGMFQNCTNILAP